MSSLAIQGITKRYGSVAALNTVNLTVAGGSRTAVVGPSGSGKTTLLRILAGFEAPDAGRVVLDGEILADGADAIPAHRRGVGIVMQDGALFPHLSIADNIGFGLERSAADRRDRIVSLMRMVELDTAMLDRRPDALSGGQQQRVALARALARRPRLMLLDEPFSALDTRLRAATRKKVAQLLKAEGITTILVTHDHAEALSFADQVAVMGGGRLLQAGTPQQLYLRPDSPVIAEFLGDVVMLPAVIANGYAECALGRIIVTDQKRCGPANIMLRPEQISLTAVRAHEIVLRDEPSGEIVDVDFSGGVCMVCLRLLNKAGQLVSTISLQQSSIGIPPVGTIVHITVTGEAHPFKESVLTNER